MKVEPQTMIVLGLILLMLRALCYRLAAGCDALADWIDPR